MAGHIRFGARTGGALVILGIIVLFTGLFLSDSVSLIFQVFPGDLGVILFSQELSSRWSLGCQTQEGEPFRSPHHGRHSDVEYGCGLPGGLILYYGLQRRWIKI